MAREKAGRSRSKKTLRQLPAQAIEGKRSGSVTGGKGKATTRLYEATCKGTHIPNVVIE